MAGVGGLTVKKDTEKLETNVGEECGECERKNRVGLATISQGSFGALRAGRGCALLNVFAVTSPRFERVGSDQAVGPTPCVCLDDGHPVLETVLLWVHQDVDRTIRVDHRSRIPVPVRPIFPRAATPVCRPVLRPSSHRTRNSTAYGSTRKDGARTAPVRRQTRICAVWRW